jgi:hypothetical protein
MGEETNSPSVAHVGYDIYRFVCDFSQLIKRRESDNIRKTCKYNYTDYVLEL